MTEKKNNQHFFAMCHKTLDKQLKKNLVISTLLDHPPPVGSWR